MIDTCYPRSLQTSNNNACQNRFFTFASKLLKIRELAAHRSMGFDQYVKPKHPKYTEHMKHMTLGFLRLMTGYG